MRDEAKEGGRDGNDQTDGDKMGCVEAPGSKKFLNDMKAGDARELGEVYGLGKVAGHTSRRDQRILGNHGFHHS